MNALITGRSICEVGGTGLYLGIIDITALLTTDAERPVYMILVGLVWGLRTMQVLLDLAFIRKYAGLAGV